MPGQAAFGEAKAGAAKTRKMWTLIWDRNSGGKVEIRLCCLGS